MPTPRLLLLFSIAAGIIACGPVPPPKNPYTEGRDLLKDMDQLRKKIRSFRITGRVDHYGDKQRVQGTIYLFAELPDRLRIELVSPFGNPMQVLTVENGQFALHDLREGRFFTGPAEPCNIARLVRIPLPPEDVMRILIGHTPTIEGNTSIMWESEGYYKVDIKNDIREQQLHVGGERNTLELRRSKLKTADGSTIFDLAFEDWDPVKSTTMPFHIRVKMPRDKADLLIRYDSDGVEINVDLPKDAWSQEPPPGLNAEILTCN